MVFEFMEIILFLFMVYELKGMHKYISAFIQVFLKL